MVSEVEKIIRELGTKELKEKAVVELTSRYKQWGYRVDELVIRTLANVDYSDVSKEAKNKALDALVWVATCKSNISYSVRKAALEGIDRIGDEDAIKRVGEYWLASLDKAYLQQTTPRKKQAIWALEKITYEPAADKAAELLPSSAYGRELEDIRPGLLRIIAKSGNSRHEKVLIPLIKADYKFGDKQVIFEGLRRFGGKKSLEKLRELLDEYEHGRDKDSPWREPTIKAAKETIAKIEERIGVSAKPAEDKIKEAMEKKKVKV
jgi:hypothetical protein